MHPVRKFLFKAENKNAVLKIPHLDQFSENFVSPSVFGDESGKIAFSWENFVGTFGVCECKSETCLDSPPGEHNVINYHAVREAVAARIMQVAKEDGDSNLADRATESDITLIDSIKPLTARTLLPDARPNPPDGVQGVPKYMCALFHLIVGCNLHYCAIGISINCGDCLIPTVLNMSQLASLSFKNT
jgi:hypothetical protein